MALAYNVYKLEVAKKSLITLGATKAQTQENTLTFNLPLGLIIRVIDTSLSPS